MRWCLDLGIRYLTVYAFSTENWRRPKAEVRFLMNDTISLVERLRGTGYEAASVVADLAEVEPCRHVVRFTVERYRTSRLYGEGGEP